MTLQVFAKNLESNISYYGFGSIQDAAECLAPERRSAMIAVSRLLVPRIVLATPSPGGNAELIEKRT